jgi:hypothetical protein
MSMTPKEANLYGLPKLGYDEEALGLTGNILEDQIAIEATCIRIEHKEHEGGLGVFGHFKNYVDLLWNNPDSGSMKRCIWNPWANKMFRKMLTERELSIAGSTSAGKCQSLDTPILMYDGTTKNAGEIQVGDVVMGDDATPRNVLEVHYGRGKMYEVTPSDGGMKWYCTEDHILVLQRANALNGCLEISAKIFAEKWSYRAQLGYQQIRSREAFEKVTGKKWKSEPWGKWKHCITLTPAGEMDWVGFSTDGNHRFLLGDFTVTHNSDPAGLYAVVRYTTDPTHTLVFVMSTTIAGAKKRIWKTVREYWESIPNLPGKLLASTNEIKGLNYRGDGYGDSSGIYLLASEKSNEKAALDKVIGIKAPATGVVDASYDSLMQREEFADLANHFDEETLRDLVPRLYNLSQDRAGKLILIIDEMTGMAESILNAVNTNLKPGNVGHFQIIGLGNPNLIYDSFGIFSKPKGGWDKVNLLTDDEWETETGGLCIRFNGEKNPRIVEQNERYSWMLRKEDIQDMENRYGRESLFFHRMVLGTWCLEGAALGVYSPADIEMSGAKETQVIWGYEPPKPVSFLDPSFTAGGDLALATFGLLGKNHEGRMVLKINESIALKTDPTNTTTPVNYQIVKAWRTECELRKVKPECAAYDRSGGGIPFGDIVSVTWSPRVTGVTTGGMASKRPLFGEKHPSTNTPVLACERFSNKATEIWHVAQPFLRAGQIFGITDDLAKELCSRQYDDAKGGDGRKVCIENKRKYKDREGKSPDESDSFLGLVDFCRERHGFICEEAGQIRAAGKMSATADFAWKHFREKARRISNRKDLRSK